MNICMFQGKGGSLNHPQGMACDIAPKFGTLVYCGMGNNAMQLRFHFVLKKIMFHFFPLKKQHFVKGVHQILAKGATRQFSHKLDHI